MQICFSFQFFLNQCTAVFSRLAFLVQIVTIFSYRLVAEIDDVLGDKHEIEFDDLGRLKYMGQVYSSILLSSGATGGLGGHVPPVLPRIGFPIRPNSMRTS